MLQKMYWYKMRVFSYYLFNLCTSIAMLHSSFTLFICAFAHVVLTDTAHLSFFKVFSKV